MNTDVLKTKIFLKIRPIFLICLILATATLAVYWQVRDHSFLIYDDSAYVTENRHVQDPLTLESIIWAFTSIYASNWHPLTWLSHMLDIQLYGLNAGGHHLTNLLFHIANTLLLFFIFNKMTGNMWPSAFVAALFALHPLHVESVAWVAERKDVLSTFFWMLTMWSYIWYVNHPQVRRYLFVVLFLAIGLMAKAMLVTLPFVLLLLDYWPLHRFQRDNYRLKNDDTKSKPTSRSVLQLIGEKLPLLVLVVISSILTFKAQQSSGAVMPLEVYSLPVRVANALVSYVNYIIKAFWPVHLTVFYPHPENVQPLWQVLAAAVAVVAVSFGTMVISKRRPYVFVGWFWYLGTLVPVIGLVQIGTQAMADRYTYVPLIGIFIIVAWGVPELLPHRNRYKRWLAVAATGLLTILAATTWRQVQYWENSTTLFNHAVNITPNNSSAHYVLGLSLERQGETDKAILHFSRALDLRPDYKILFKMGHVMYQKGKLEEAKIYYKESLRMNPVYAEAHNNLGIILARQGDLNGAVEHYRAALRINPNHAGAYYNLGRIAANRGKTSSAVLYYRTALLIESEMTPVLYQQAWIAATHENEKFRDGMKAVELAEKLCRLTDDKEPLALDVLAAAYAEVGRYNDAVASVQKALKMAMIFGSEDLILQLQKRLQLYRSGSPYRQNRDDKR